jgi:glycosyltransferase involved in cell wall biosynthesis
MRKVLMRWQAGTLSGWGILGLNLFEHWALDSEIQPLMGIPLDIRAFPGTSPLRYQAMRPAADASNQFLEALVAGKTNLKDQAVLAIDPFGNGLVPVIQISGQHGVRNVARCIFENTRVDSADALEPYDSVVCASDWAAKLLRSITRVPVTIIHEGIDHSQFFPGPRSGILNRSKFYVFSGGKIEYRKAQDLVIRAFSEFAARHDDAVLVTAWHSPWPVATANLKLNRVAPLRQDEKGAPLISRWAQENGIPPNQFIELPLTANSLMPAVLREMDCALQVSRCEACTNLVAMEAMACGVPVILANNTGVQDLVGLNNCVALNSQDLVVGPADVGTDGWGESRAEEIVAALEMLYTDTRTRVQIGAQGADWILERRRTWRDHSKMLRAHVMKLLQ